MRTIFRTVLGCTEIDKRVLVNLVHICEACSSFVLLGEKLRRGRSYYHGQSYYQGKSLWGVYDNKLFFCPRREIIIFGFLMP